MENQQLRVFKRSKRKWLNEKIALADVVEQQKLQADQLTAAHTEKHFVWTTPKVIQKPKYESDFPVFEYSMEDYTEADAVATAQTDLNTFEANLKPLHTETHYVFTKVRG